MQIDYYYQTKRKKHYNDCCHNRYNAFLRMLPFIYQQLYVNSFRRCHNMTSKTMRANPLFMRNNFEQAKIFDEKCFWKAEIEWVDC